MISIHADSSAVFRAEAKPRCGNPGPRDKAWIAIISGQLGVRYVGLTDTCKNQGVEENRRCTLKQFSITEILSEPLWNKNIISGQNFLIFF